MQENLNCPDSEIKSTEKSICSVIYFSGTGGTKRVAKAIESSLLNRNYQVNLIAIDQSASAIHSTDELEILKKSSTAILVFAVHAFDAPEPVYEWISQIRCNDLSTAVLSVSGGGEVWPNIGCREDIIKLLESHGFNVKYEKMLVMPCNWVFKIDDNLSMHLINEMPNKVDKILDKFLTKTIRRTNHHKGWLARKITLLEKKTASRFAQSFNVSERCISCQWCVKHCPVNNIQLVKNKPVFSNKCVMCFRCVYGCKIGAIETKNFQVLKKGFDLNALETRMKNKTLKPMNECCKGIMWSGVRKYLNDEDGY